MTAGVTIWWTTRPAAPATQAVNHTATARIKMPLGATKLSSEPAARLAQSTVKTAAHEEAPVATSLDPALKATQHVRLDRPLREWVEATRAKPAPLHIPLPLRPGQEFDFHVRRIESNGEDAGTLIGEITGQPGSFVVLSYIGLAQAGTVQLSNQGVSFRFRGTEDGALRIDEVDLTKAPECANCLAAHHEHGTATN